MPSVPAWLVVLAPAIQVHDALPPEATALILRVPEVSPDAAAVSVTLPAAAGSI